MYYGKLFVFGHTVGDPTYDFCLLICHIGVRSKRPSSVGVFPFFVLSSYELWYRSLHTSHTRQRSSPEVGSELVISVKGLLPYGFDSGFFLLLSNRFFPLPLSLTYYVSLVVSFPSFRSLVSRVLSCLSPSQQ